MAWACNDFWCHTCEVEFEEFYRREGPDDFSEVRCPSCAGDNLERLISATALNGWSMLTPAEKAAKLKKRSADHTRREVAKEPERFGEAGIQAQQEFKSIQSGYRGSKKKK